MSIWGDLGLIIFTALLPVQRDASARNKCLELIDDLEDVLTRLAFQMTWPHRSENDDYECLKELKGVLKALRIVKHDLFAKCYLLNEAIAESMNLMRQLNPNDSNPVHHATQTGVRIFTIWGVIDKSNEVELKKIDEIRAFFGNPFLYRFVSSLASRIYHAWKDLPSIRKEDKEPISDTLEK